MEYERVSVKVLFLHAFVSSYIKNIQCKKYTGRENVMNVDRAGPVYLANVEGDLAPVVDVFRLI